MDASQPVAQLVGCRHGVIAAARESGPLTFVDMPELPGAVRGAFRLLGARHFVHLAGSERAGSSA
jgi:hypothetical protein